MSHSQGPVSAELLAAFDQYTEELEADTPQQGNPNCVPFTDFSDLDNILSAAREQQKSADFGRLARKQLAAGGLSKDEAASITSKLREWEAQREWDTVAEGALTVITHCTCCRTTTRSFGGFFLRQRSKLTKGIERWIAIPKPQGRAFGQSAMLPKERILREVKQAYCLGCLPSRGFGDVPEVIWESGEDHA